MKQPGLDNRHRDKNGQIRRKNGNTKLATLREQYGTQIPADYSNGMHLDTLLERENATSLSEILNRPR